jgi:hypothetical protein
VSDPTDPTEPGAPNERGVALPDGTYDVLVVDATEHDDGSVAVELTIVAGPSKGEIVTLRASGLDGDPLDLLGVPATVTVAGGVPAVVFET